MDLRLLHEGQPKTTYLDDPPPPNEGDSLCKTFGESVDKEWVRLKKEVGYILCQVDDQLEIDFTYRLGQCFLNLLQPRPLLKETFLADLFTS